MPGHPHVPNPLADCLLLDFVKQLLVDVHFQVRHSECKASTAKCCIRHIEVLHSVQDFLEGSIGKQVLSFLDLSFFLMGFVSCS
jgi:hypothetical protein